MKNEGWLTKMEFYLLHYSPRPFRPIKGIRNGIREGYPLCCTLWWSAFSWLPDWFFVHGLWRWLRVPSDYRAYVPCPHHYHSDLKFHDALIEENAR